MAIRKNPNLKRANTEVEFSPSQLLDLKKCAQDPIYFVRKYVKTQHPVKGIIPLNLYDYQEDMIKAYRDNRFCITLSSRQTGKEQPHSAKIATPDGWTTMGDIAVGDVVLTPDGSSAAVIGKFPQGQKDVYRLTFDDGSFAECGLDHLWSILLGHNGQLEHKPRVLQLRDILEIHNKNNNLGDEYPIAIRFPTVNQVQFLEKELPIDPYVLGVLLNLDWVQTKKVDIYKSNMAILSDLGLTEASNKFKFIPTEYLTASHIQRWDLLLGILGLDDIPQTAVFRTQSDMLRDDVQQLVWSLGGKCHIQSSINSWNYTLHISFFNYTDTSHTKYKYVRTLLHIEQVRVEESSCIHINHPDQLYITNNFTVTHNTVCAAAYILWYATFNFDKTILIAANKNSNAMEMIHRIRIAYENLPMFLKPGIEDGGWNKHSIGFDNGTRILSEATSENSGRGLAISCLYLDEFAFVAPNIQEEFWASISPTLATGGSCIMTSTPNGDMDLFATLWRGALVGTNGFHPIRIYWDQPPGRDLAFKADQIGKLGERRWAQEFECEFLSSESLLINPQVLAALTPIIESKQPISSIKDTRTNAVVVLWEEIVEGKTYLIGVDPATGNGEDFSVIVIYEFPTLRQVGEYRSNSMSTNDLYNVLKNVLIYLERKQTTVYFSIENNGVGEGIISLYEADETIPENIEFVSDDGKGKRGMTTTSRTKMRACINLKELIEKSNIEISSSVLLAELKMFIRSKGAYAAQPGGTDDCVSATLIIIRLIEAISTYDQTAFDKLYNKQLDEWNYDNWDGYTGGYDANAEEPPILVS